MQICMTKSDQNAAMKTPEFDWNLMRSFLTVMERGSLMSAARHLGSSQPTIGRHIAQLEAQLGVTLFERTGQALTPTATAHLIAERAQAMAGGAEAVARVLAGRDAEAGGTVRITASQVVACHLLPPLLERLHSEHPGIQVELVATNEVSNLLRREADIAVRMVRPEQGSLVARRVGQVHVGLYGALSYLKRKGTPRTLDDLADHDLIGFDRDPTILRGFAAMGQPATRERFCLRSDDHLAAWAAVRAGIGLGWAATYVAEPDPTVKRVLPDMPIPPLPVWLAVHREVRSSPRIRLVYEFLRDALVHTLAG
jgi:DNA-binding transcriptional LysR family regulator